MDDDFNRRGRKEYEPQYVAPVRIDSLQQWLRDTFNTTLNGYQGGSKSDLGSSLAVTNLLKTIKDMLMALSAQVQTLVDQVAASKSIEASSAASLAQLVTQSKSLADQVAALTAAGTGMSAEDAAAIAQASTDLHDSAAALAAAAPQNTAPVPPAEVIPPVVAPSA